MTFTSGEYKTYSGGFRKGYFFGIGTLVNKNGISKEAIYKDVKNLSLKDQLKHISLEAKKIARKYYLPVKKNLNGTIQRV